MLVRPVPASPRGRIPAGRLHPAPPGRARLGVLRRLRTWWLPGRRPRSLPQVVSQVRLVHRLVDGDEPYEDPSDLATCQGAFRKDDSVPADEGDAAGEIDAKAPCLAGFGRQRFANHAA